MSEEIDMGSAPDLYCEIWKEIESYDDVSDEDKVMMVRQLYKYYQTVAEEVSPRHIEFSLELFQLIDEYDDVPNAQLGDELSEANKLLWRRS